MKNIFKAPLAFLLCAAMLLTSLCAASAESKSAEGFVYDRYAVSPTMRKLMPEKMYEAFLNLTDAVYAGETTFKCADQEAYDWVLGVYTQMISPVISAIVHEPYKGTKYKKGVGHFIYTIPEEDVPGTLRAFEELTAGILNGTTEPGCSDLEKALALYMYFSEHYTYDYDALKIGKAGYVGEDYTSPYRLLTTGTGICREIAPAYSFLLVQAGVDATLASHPGTAESEPHVWSLVKVNGRYFHVDPTFVLGKGYDLDYFMMTDMKRMVEGDYDKEQFTYCCSYLQEQSLPELACTDDTYSALWGTVIEGMNTVENTIDYLSLDGDDVIHFTYSD